jgi:antirestriction protein ArdC
MDTYEVVTERIMAALESGVVPWRRPWTSHGPQNAVSKRPYRGINVFLLAGTPYAEHRWLTFNQAKELGGNVRRGEKSTPVVLWKWLKKESEETGKVEEVPILRFYSVFNAEQCDGLNLPTVDSLTRGPVERIAAAEEIVTGYPSPPQLEYIGERACYIPAKDLVRMPPLERFESAERAYSTLFHELAHSTGHATRLNRKNVAESMGFGSDTYSREELCAEMSAAFLCNRAGIDSDATTEQSASYIAGWLRALKNDRKLVVTAAAQAQRAADHILDAREGGSASDDE